MSTQSLNFTEQDFQMAATTFRPQLLRIPILAIADVLKYMTPRYGVRYAEMVGQLTGDVEFAPYKKAKSESLLNMVLRTLRTFFGYANVPFEPNGIISTLLGHTAAQASGDELAQTPSALEVLAYVAKRAGESLVPAIWNAVRKENGTKTKDLFNGFDTITATEIEAGNISEDKGNLVTIDEPVTKDNAVDVAKKIVTSMDDVLREQDSFMFCSRAFCDAYNEGYLLTHTSTPYNQQYNQVYVEGSNNRVTLVPMVGKKNSDFITVSTKENMLVGMDQMSDLENVRVKEFEIDELLFMLRMFFGTEFESIDPRRLLVAKLTKE